MLKVVFDTVVLVRALINPHSVCGRLVFGYYARYRLFVSRAVVLEILEVLRRPELVSKFRALEGFDVTRAIELISQAEVVNVPAVPAVARDPKDDKFLATAAAASADYLVSEDQDLLVLRTYEETRIVDALTFLRILEQEPGA